jgi:DNA-binding NarL/FixJ family response regulator
MEILELIAQGMSNREIAAELFVSENKVKTHSSRVFDKLGARRRTQAQNA